MLWCHDCPLRKACFLASSIFIAKQPNITDLFYWLVKWVCNRSSWQWKPSAGSEDKLLHAVWCASRLSILNLNWPLQVEYKHLPTSWMNGRIKSDSSNIYTMTLSPPWYGKSIGPVMSENIVPHGIPFQPVGMTLLWNLICPSSEYSSNSLMASSSLRPSGSSLSHVSRVRPTLPFSWNDHMTRIVPFWLAGMTFNIIISSVVSNTSCPCYCGGTLLLWSSDDVCVFVFS